jgi:hypothetical protein
MASEILEKVIVNFTQGADYLQNIGKLVQEAENAKDTAIVRADQAKNSADQAKESANAAKSYANAAEQSAQDAATSANGAYTSSTQAHMYAETAFGASAPAWDANETYNYPTVVAYTDGHTYRCVGINVTGTDIPGDSDKWVGITLDTDDFFDVDFEGRYMPSLYPTFSSKWGLDALGNIEPI